MELDDLQKTWRKLNQDAPPEETLNTETLRTLLQGKSRGVLERLRINSLSEVRINMACAVLLFIGILVEDNFLMRILFGGFLIYEVLLGYYFYKKLTLLHQFVSPDENLKDYLTRLNKQLRIFITVYKYGNALLMPPAFLAGLFMGAYYNSRGFFAQWVSQNTTHSLLIITSFTIIASLLGYLMVHWWINYLYGVHLKRLEEYAEELA